MIEFQQVRKTFEDPSGGTVTAVDDLDLRVEDGTIHCLIGTSGCGKTTTLRLVNRLEDATAGSVLVDGRDVRDHDVIELRRRIGYVIQTGGLFPHMTIEANVGVMCELEEWPAECTRERTRELLELVGLEPGEFGARLPGELSGGQRQRVGVARALALDPDHLLMDEPFGALDPITRTRLHADFEALTERVHKTILLVTHDLREAFRLGDRVSLMRDGRIVQSGTEADFVETPADDFVREFVAAHAAGGSRA